MRRSLYVYAYAYARVAKNRLARDRTLARSDDERKFSHELRVLDEKEIY